MIRRNDYLGRLHEAARKILDFAESQCAPVSETVSAEITRIRETRAELDALMFDAWREENHHKAANKALSELASQGHQWDVSLRLESDIEREGERHRAALDLLAARVLKAQANCRHWLRGARWRRREHCDHCGKVF